MAYFVFPMNFSSGVAQIVQGAGTAGAADTHVVTVQGIASGVAQPVSGTVAVSNSFALDSTLTGGTQQTIVRGGAKGATAAATITGTANGADHQGLDVQIQNSTLTAVGNLTHNNAAPAANHIAALTAVANVAPPTFVEGDEVLLSADLAGRLRVAPPVSVAGANVPLAISQSDANTTLTGGILYRVGSNVDCFVNVGSAAVANSSLPIYAGVPEVFQFATTGSPVVHVICLTGASGYINFTPLT